jgi:hypothetical protein
MHPTSQCQHPFSPYPNDRQQATPQTPNWFEIIVGAFIVFKGARASRLPIKAICILSGSCLLFKNLPNRRRGDDGEPTSSSSWMETIRTADSILSLVRLFEFFFPQRAKRGTPGALPVDTMWGSSRHTVHRAQTDRVPGRDHSSDDDGDDVSREPARFGSLSR